MSRFMVKFLYLNNPNLSTVNLPTILQNEKPEEKLSFHSVLTV